MSAIPSGLLARKPVVEAMMQKPSKGVSDKRRRLPKELSQINLNAAEIDVGANSHFVAVPEDREVDPE